MLDAAKIREDFPGLAQEVRGHALVYLDSASTAQKPRAVLAALQHAYTFECANIHRGVHWLSQLATERYEAVRGKVARFVGAGSREEVVFTRGTTEAINLLAHGLGAQLSAGDEVVVSGLEHHSNFVPWQMLCERRQAQLRLIPLDEHGQLRLEALPGLLGPRTRIVSLSHASNALGHVVPVAEVVRQVRRLAPAARVVVDGAQAVPHLRVDVGALGCDFYCFSGHKLFGPTGVGALWGRAELLAELPPWQGGGDMIQSVSTVVGQTLYRESPYRFEAGTPPIAEVIGLGAAIDYLESIGLDAIARHEAELRAHAVAVLGAVPGLRLLGGPGAAKVPVVSFELAGVHPHDVGTALDFEGIAVRTGHHCAQPLMEHLGVPGTVRASLALYNTKAELDALAGALRRVRGLFG